jgi:hypothetical protein
MGPEQRDVLADRGYFSGEEIPASPAIAQDAIKGITIDEAKSLSDREFAQRLMSLLSVVVVDVDRQSFSGSDPDG